MRETTKRPAQQSAPGPFLVKTKDIPSHVGGNVWMWRSLTWEGKIPFIKVGNTHWFDVRDLKAWIERSKSLN